MSLRMARQEVFVRREGEQAARVSLFRVRAAAVAMLSAMRVGPAELSVVLCDDAVIKKLNAKFRSKNKPTDVLAFALEEGAALRAPRGAPRMLGDVVISLDTAKLQAKARGAALLEEIVTLLAHGILHLLGYDHRTDAEEAMMNGEARRIGRIGQRAAEAAVSRKG